MTTWRDKTDDDCVMCQHLYRDDDVVLGAVDHRRLGDA
jgi:hypothetical protein